MKNTKYLTSVSLLITLSIILARFLSLRIGFGDFPLMLTGILFGPWWGTLAGIIADIVGYFLSPMGSYMPHFTLISALKGILPGILFIFAISKLIVSYSVLIPPRAITLIVEVPIYTIVTFPVLNRLDKEVF